MSTVFDAEFIVDGVARLARFTVPGTPENPILPNDVVIWIHGGDLSGALMSGIIPPRPSRIDVFPTALATNGEVSGTYPTLVSDCTLPLGWALPGMPTAPPFAGRDCAYLVGGKVDYGADPMCPQLVSRGILDTWTDLRFVCSLIRNVRTGVVPIVAVGGVALSHGGRPLSPWRPLPADWRPRFWLAGFSKGAQLALWAHAYNQPWLSAPGVSGIDQLADVSGYWISSAAMPDIRRSNAAPMNATFDRFSDPYFYANVAPRICGYWHGGEGENMDTVARNYLPGLSFDASARILAEWYGGVTWSGRGVLRTLPRVCLDNFIALGGDSGFVQKQIANDAYGTTRLLERYEVINGRHTWSRPMPAGPAPLYLPCGHPTQLFEWDEALVATNLWRNAAYGT